MKITGIVCEYDPFHNGHAYLIERAREESDAVVCVMSGHFTQRGTPAFADKYTRAEAALREGADLVLELPYPYCSASAAYFAAASVAILNAVGASHICFGSERGDAEVLERLARLALSQEWAAAEADEGAAGSYFDALAGAYEKKYGQAVTLEPNDILAVEYLKAIYRHHYDITPQVVRRLGDGFLTAETGASAYPSATALRAAISERGIDAVRNYMPASSHKLLGEAIARGDAPASMERLTSAILTFFRLTDASALSKIAELGNGLEHRLCRAACDSSTLAQFFAAASTKKYTDARIRRAVFYAMLGVTREDLERLPSYALLLGANSAGRAVLSELRRRETNIPIITKPADAQAAASRQYALSLAADALFTQVLPQPRPVSYFLKKSAVIL